MPVYNQIPVMFHGAIGNIGHLFVITSFVAALIAAFCYWTASKENVVETKKQWLFNGRVGFIVHSISVLGIILVLFTIIYSHYFEYHYAYAHSSRHLPGQYMIACFWEGQEGSFLLWMFWQALLGIVFLTKRDKWEAPMITILALIQAFLASMILGIVIPGLNIKIGSSPFILLRDAMTDPIFQLQPLFIPKDGNGLNPLLQNYWMVIHPPVLFLGFALTSIPFSYCVSGLWKKQYSEWIKPAFPWTILGVAILGLGIIMGGYWAYETLSFGGYWNWDPVENAVYIPWIILIASLHTMMTYEASKQGLKFTIILVLAVFILILYSTFLTRSGILGESSVHSFTDLGLSGQLLIYLLFFIAISVFLVLFRWKNIPTTSKELTTYNKEFWVFLGATVLCLTGFQVFIETSKPVYNSIIRLFGAESNLAPPIDAVAYYSGFQLWFAVSIALLSGISQLLWWEKSEKNLQRKKITATTLISLIVFALIILIANVNTPIYMVLLFSGIFTIVSNLFLLYNLLKIKPNLSGGSISHIGIGLMIIGILFSAGYSKVVSLNNTGMLYNSDMGTEFNRDNLLLFVNETRTMDGFDIEFLGEFVEARNKRGYIKKTALQYTSDPYKVIAKKDILFGGKMLYNSKDTFEIYPENTFYKIQLSKNGKISATLFPRIQTNSRMGGILASPDITHTLTRDLYTHVSAPMPADVEPSWSKTEEIRVSIGKPFFVNDYVAVLEKVVPVDVSEIPGLNKQNGDMAVKVVIKVEGENDIYYAEPIFLIRNKNEIGQISSEIGELGSKLTLLNIHPETDEFTLGLNSRQKNWVIIKAIEKPFINVLWIGTIILTIGLVMATYRRFYNERSVSD